MQNGEAGAKGMSRKAKLIDRLLSRSPSITWREVETLMGACGFEMLAARGGGAGRMFRHGQTGHKVRLHEPHPEPTLKPYMIKALIDALRDAGEIEET